MHTLRFADWIGLAERLMAPAPFQRTGYDHCGAPKGTMRVSSFPFAVIAGPAIYLGETGIDDPQRAKKRWFHEGIRDVSR
jgi:hypothetical protein